MDLLTAYSVSVGLNCSPVHPVLAGVFSLNPYQQYFFHSREICGLEALGGSRKEGTEPVH